MVILITGITSGFGRAMAERLNADGHKVYGTYRRECQRIEGVTYIKADVTVQADVEAVVGTVLGAEGRIDVFINNAGAGYYGPLEYATEEEVRAQMEVNFMAITRFVPLVLPGMRARGSGKIICISSIGGRIGLPFQGLYSSSKFALEGYCESLNLELRRTGVRVVLVEPGDFATNFTAVRRKQEGDAAAKAYPSMHGNLETIEHDENSGLKPEYLAKLISRIVRKDRPRFRYVISNFFQKLALSCKGIVPDRLYNSLFAIYYKL